MGYCPKCGNTGVRLDGTPCDCQLPTDTIYADLIGLDLPDQYQGVRFSRALVPLDCGDSYGKVLEELHKQITTLQLSNQNVCVCAPPMHGKTIWVYSCIQNLFRQRIPVVPLWDVLEPVSYTHLDVYKRQKRNLSHGYRSSSSRRLP